MDRKSIIEEWYSLYADDIYNFLIYYTNNTDAEDILQEVFIKLFKGLDHFQGNSSPKTWLLKIARNTAIDHLRRKKRLQNLKSIKSFEISHSPEEITIFNEDVAELYSKINSLSKKHREVIILRGILQLSVEESANITGWPEQKVRLTYHRAKKKLKESYYKGGTLDEWIRKGI